MNRRPVVGMSLKNYLNTNSKTAEYCQSLRQLTGGETKVEQFLFPSLGALPAAQSVLQHRCNIAYGAQNITSAQNGTYTGEYSIETLLELAAVMWKLGTMSEYKYFMKPQR